jgi:hypothetical protein
MRYLMCFASLSVLLASGCDVTDGPFPSEQNLNAIFYGLAVDQDGKPLPGATIQYEVLAYPPGAGVGRSYDYERSTVKGTTGSDGTVTIRVAGCLMKLIKAERPNYQHYWETNSSDQSLSVVGIRLIAGGEQQYRPIESNPAVFVFVADGRTDVSAMPGRGGAQWNGLGWSENPRLVPSRPSIPGLTIRPATK